MTDLIKVIAGVIAVAQALYLPAKEALIIGILITMITLLILRLKAIRDARKWWGQIADPIWIIDWAKYGEDILLKIPADLRDQVVAVPPSKVFDTVKSVKEKLTRRKNYLYLEKDEKKRLPVNYLFFRKGRFVNERGKDYIERVIADMRAEKLAWHTRWDEAPKEAVAELSYFRTFLATHRNGSLN